jgi:hypothetical protein
MGTPVSNPVVENVSFTAQIGYYAGPTGTYTNEIAQWLKDGVKDVIRKISVVSPHKLSLFTSTEEVTNAGLVLTTPYVFHVYQGTKTATELPLEHRHQAADSSSIYYATLESPIYYISENRLYRLPESGTAGYAEIVKYSTPNDSSSPSIDFFPEQYYTYVVLFASANVLHAKMVAKMGNTDVLDCLTKAKDAIDTFKAAIDEQLKEDDGIDDDFKLVDKYINIAFAYLTDWKSELITHSDYNPLEKAFDFEAMQEDEDVELAQTAMSGAQAQLNLAQILLGRIKDQVQVASQYPQAAQGYLNTAQGILSKDNTEYQWLAAQMAYVKQKYEEGFIPEQQ